ncbi:MAG: hypothetical protein ACRC92_24010 [Peptostreptococcaceae bacterium]
MFNGIKKQMFKNKITQLISMKPELLQNQKCIKLKSSENDFKMSDISHSLRDDDIEFMSRLTRVATVFVCQYPNGHERTLIVPQSILRIDEDILPYKNLCFGDTTKSVIPKGENVMFTLIRESYSMALLCDVIETLTRFLGHNEDCTTLTVYSNRYILSANNVSHEAVYFISCGGQQSGMLSIILDKKESCCFDLMATRNDNINNFVSNII